MNALGPGFEHSVLALNGGYSASSLVDAGVNLTLGVPPKKASGPGYIVNLLRVIRNLKPQVLLTYNWGAIEAAAAARVHSLCPVIHTEDGFGADEATRLKRRRVWTRQLVLRHIYKTVVPSQTLLRIAREQYCVPVNKIAFIPNGVNASVFHPGRNEALRARNGVDSTTVLFGYVGHLRPEKNLSLLLSAFAVAKLQGVRLALIGDGECREGLERAARELRIDDRVIFTGHVNDAASWYSALDVFVMSSLTEQMSLSLLEAMASGLPAISTDVGDSAHLLGTSQQPVIAPGDPQSYGLCMRRMTTDADLRRRVGQANRSRALSCYSASSMIEQYRSLYATALLTLCSPAA